MILDKRAALGRMGGNERMYRDIVALFLEDAPIQIDNIKEAYRREDMAEVGLLAHSLKSASAAVGSVSFSELMLTLERASRRGDVEACDAVVSEMEEVFFALKNELRRR